MKNFIQSKYFTYAVFAVFTVALFVWFMVSDFSSPLKGDKNTPPVYETQKQEIRFKEPTLTFFDQKIVINFQFDTLNIHYPYIIVTKKAEEKTRLFNIETKKEEDAIDGVLIDYMNGNTLEDKGGKTFFNNKELTEKCFYGFIKNDKEVFCTLHEDPSNIWIINTENNSKIGLGGVENNGVITDIYYDDIKQYLYAGVIDTENNNSPQIFIYEGQKQVGDELSSSVRLLTDVPNIPSEFFIFSNEKEKSYMYFASFNSKLNDNTEGYYQILESGEIITKSEDEIIFFSE